MKKFFAFGIAAIVVVLLVSAGSFNAQNAMAQATVAATATKKAPPPTKTPSVPPTPSRIATADANLSIAGSGKVAGPLSGEAKTLTGSGATFPLNLYLNWVKTYKTLTNVAINYNGSGSGAGRKDIIANAVDFAGSDFPMSATELAAAAKNGTVLHIPTTLGAIVLAYNIPELKGKEALKLTGDEVAKIYMGTIVKWDDPALTADNPQLAGIDQDILPVYRSDSSGTTQNFTTYLSFISKDWASTVKSGSQVNFPVGTGSQGNPGVASSVNQTPYAIGYIELSFVGKLSYASIKNAAGTFIVPSADTVSKAVIGITFDADLRTIIIPKITDPGAYPISVMTWQLVYEKQSDVTKAIALTRFLWWETHDGQKYNASLGYAPLPQAVVALDEAQILKITVDGNQALPTTIATPAPMMAGTMSATMAPTMGS